MYDVRYVEENLSASLSRRNRFYSVNAVGIVVFLVLSFLLGPLVHELLQIGLLVLYNCHYVFSPFFDWRMGLSASVMPQCALSQFQEVLLYSLGVGVNLFVAFAFILFSWFLLKRGSFYSSNLCLYFGLGFSFNPIVYFFAKSGNLMNLFRALGMDSHAYLLPLAGSVLFGMEAAYGYVVVRYYKEEYDNIKKRISGMRALMKDISYGCGI